MKRSAHVSGDAAIQDEVLEDLSSAVEYRRWICDLARPWLGDRPIELGSGTGDYALELATEDIHITASEALPGRVEALQQRFTGNASVDVRRVQLPDVPPGTWTSAVAVNVLEHIEDDVAALAAMSKLVIPGGHVVVFVPAMPVAMSRFDREVGHYRRYGRDELAAKMVQVGLKPTTVHYVNLPGLLAWLLVMKMARGRPREGLALRAFERIVPALRRSEARWPPPFGQSVFGVGRVQLAR